MNYYDSSNNKIRRRKVSSSNLNKAYKEENVINTNKELKSSTINRLEVDKDVELEKKLFYKKRDKKRRQIYNITKKSLSILLMIACLGTVLASIFVAVSLKGAPHISKDLIYNSYISQNVVPISEIPDDLKNAIVATEDKRFYEHKGVDYKSLARSLVNNILSDSTQGGSTIDMQVSKNILTSDDRSMKRKIRDIYNAIQLNKIMTKDEILETYLNNIYFGKGSYGVASAAKTYFGKDVRDLNLAQCAMLAGITNNPARYMQHDEAKNRQEVVLKHMYDQGYITYDEYRKAIGDETPFKSEIE